MPPLHNSTFPALLLYKGQISYSTIHSTIHSTIQCTHTFKLGGAVELSYLAVTVRFQSSEKYLAYSG